MIDNYFGTKDLTQVTLKAYMPMTIGDRHLEAGEPLLYFDRIHVSNLTEEATPIIARGGWGNMPQIIWENHSEVRFSFSEGVMNNMSFGLLLNSRVIPSGIREIHYVPMRDGPFEIDDNNQYITRRPISQDKPFFCYEFDYNTIQRKVECSAYENILTISNGDPNKIYILEYYTQYGDEAMLYLIEQERFGGLFTLEGKFESKDENEGLVTTNILTMPKVRIVSSVNLRLGSGVNPTVSNFDAIAMPVQTDLSRYTLVEVLRLGEDMDSDI